MEWNDIEEILKIPERDWEKEIYKMPVNLIGERIEKLRSVTIKPDLGMPLLVSSEREPKRKKLLAIQHLLESIRDKKLKEEFDQNRKTQEKWRDETLKENLPDIRYAVGSSVEHLRHGTLSMDVVEWIKPQSTEFEITTISGHKTKINLQKIITPSTLKILLEKAFTPVYVTIEAQGGYDRHGKRMGYYMSPEWDETHGIEIRMGTTMAIMRV
jgi:hypothetical protein